VIASDQLSIVEQSTGIPRPGDFPITTTGKLRFPDTNRNVHITITVFAVSPKSEQQEAEKRGRECYEVSVRQIAKRIASEDRMVAEIVGRIANAQEDRFARPIGNGATQPGTSQPLEAPLG
jgi:hypothetical protein